MVNWLGMRNWKANAIKLIKPQQYLSFSNEGNDVGVDLDGDPINEPIQDNTVCTQLNQLSAIIFDREVSRQWTILVESSGTR